MRIRKGIWGPGLSLNIDGPDGRCAGTEGGI